MNLNITSSKLRNQYIVNCRYITKVHEQMIGGNTKVDVKKELSNITDQLLKIKHFDIESFVYNYKRMVNSIYHFHNTIGKHAKTPSQLSKIKYNLKGMKKPIEGDVCYFYIENSYPKEIFNSHWCLILKDFGNTMLVVPMVSIKAESAPLDRSCEIIVKIKDFEENGCSKLKIHQMFSADIMRINPAKSTYRLQTNFDYVKNKIRELTNLS